MKIFIPFKIQDIGGTSTFASIFTKKLQEAGHEVYSTLPKKYDILFIIADCPLKYVLHAKLNKNKIIQRLDGVYHRATPAEWKYPLYNLKMKIIHNYFADFAIYQSSFSKLSCEKFLGKRKSDFKIIYNGVEIQNNQIQEKKDNTVKLITYAKFRRKDQILPIIQTIKQLPQNYTLDIYGSFVKETISLLPEIEKIKNINIKGKLSHPDLLKVLPSYDIFLFSDQSACPNSVLEAMAAGLAVVAYNRGSIDELVIPHYNGEIARLNNHNPFKEKYPFNKENYNDFVRKIKKIAENLQEYKKNSLIHAAKKFNINKSISNYIQVIKS